MTTAATAQQPGPGTAYHHEAFLYAGLGEFTPAISEFVRGGVAAGDPTMVMVSRDKIEALRWQLGSDADAVTFVDMGVVGANPARIIPAWLDFVARAGSRSMRGVGEPITADRSAAELVECRRHEELLNLAVGPDTPLRLVCPYDTASLPPAVIEDAERTHPLLADGFEHRTSPRYAGVARDFDEPLPEPAAAEVVAFGVLDLPYVRDVVAARARAEGLGRSATNDLVLAINELATNSLRYGGGQGTLRIWPGDGALVCEVRDGGYIDQPLVGRRTPAPDRGGGRGLWMVNQLCDLTQVRSSPLGTTIRVHQRHR